MGISPLQPSNSAKPQQFNDPNTAILNRPGIAEVLTGLNLKKKDIKSVDVHEGISILNINKNLFKKIKKNLDDISTLNKEELNKLVSLLGLDPSNVMYVEHEGGYYLVKESLDQLEKSLD